MSQDIREWARDNGWDLATKGRIPGEARAAYDAAHNGHHDPAQDDDSEPFAILPGDTPPPPAPPKDPAPAERPPSPPAKPSRWRKPKTPGPARKRVSIENIISSGWALGAMALMRKPEAIPVARVMDMQAPVAGVIGEELLAGTIVDKVLQPFARGGRKAELGFALIGPPLLVGAMTARPELFPVLRTPLKMAMMSWMEISEPAMKKVIKRQADWSEKFGDVDLDGMIDALFAGVAVPSEAEEEAIRRARGEG